MTNAVSMGPPPSPKEPRRSGRRSVPSASASKSPAGSPTSDAPPKSKDANPRVNPPPSSNGGRAKRAKLEELDDNLDDVPKNNGNTNGRTKRRGKEKEKEKEKVALSVDTQLDEYAQNGDENVKDGGGDAPDDEEQGITRCPCEVLGEEDPGEGTMVECEDCGAWQHGSCMGFPTEEVIPDSYFCEQCRPEMYPDLIKRLKKVRQASMAHHIPASQSRNSRSHSPVSLMKQQTKRRNTMNSRDAAYEQSLQAVIDASAAEALASNRAPGEGDEGSVVGGDVGQDAEITVGARRKRKRIEDDAASVKRNRSASIVSDRQAMPPPRDPTPMSVKASVPPSAAPKAPARPKRPGGRKAQVQDPLHADNEEAVNTSSARRQGNPRARAAAGHEQGSRRNQSNGANQGATSTAHVVTTASSRSYHNSHAYAVSQQPLLTSWNLPDYLAHLSHTLPTDTPRPLEVRGFSVGTNGQEAMERTTERGVKVKWPGKRMSVGDMNKRVRALVEWVGREQASAAERTRRKEALEKALKDNRGSRSNAPHMNGVESGGDVPMVLDGKAVTQSPLQERQPSGRDSALPAPTVAGSLSVDAGSETMKMMEELMEELISFQERYGPGVKVKERERRTVS
ncbi:hypothetical protein BXZ70DRAFT_19622 [Cristinia sonorae]|uniref:Zinc finger PHD-type domain-containing protein n=1 Tax=Cristinia sonorae TaxID=1940300 RepID=A0A8K0UYA8_9AGAR|nr:hypothetical protein BXZ70DRAFT_19622 [Cristinia sonorae]